MESTQYSNPSSPAESDAETQHLGFGSTESVVTGDEWEFDLISTGTPIIAGNQDIDVVDGGPTDEARTHEQGETDRPFGQLRASLPTRSSLERGSSSAFAEVISSTPTNPSQELGSKVQKWMDTCNFLFSSDTDTRIQMNDCSFSCPSETTTTLQNIKLVKQLCKDKLRNWKPGKYMTESISDDFPGCFQPIIALLIDNNVPEAMMLMIDILCSENARPGPSKVEHDRSLRSTLLKILTCSKDGENEEDELDSVSAEKTLAGMTDVFKPNSQYFAPISLHDLRLEIPNKYHGILLAVEKYVNRSIKLALECRKTVFEVDYANIASIFNESNVENNKFAVEKGNQMAGSAHAFVRNLIYLRCINFLAANGFDFRVEVDSDKQDCMSPSNSTDRMENLLFFQDELHHPSHGAPSPELVSESFVEPPPSVQNTLREPESPSSPEMEFVRHLANIPFDAEYIEGLSPPRGDVSNGSVSPTYELSLPRMSRTPPGSSDEENSQNTLSLSLDATYYSLDSMLVTPPKRRRHE